MSELIKSVISIIVLFDLLIVFWAGVDQVIFEIKKCIKKKKGSTKEDDWDELEGFEFDMIPKLSVDVIRNMCSIDIKDFVKKRICQRKEFEKLSEEEKDGAVLLLSSYITFLQEEAPVDEQNFPTLLYMLNCSKVYEDYEEIDAVECLFKESSTNKELNEKYYYDYLKYKMETPNRAMVLDKCKVAVYEITEKLYGDYNTKFYIWNNQTSKNIKDQMDCIEIE